jgi:hypothetical protein
MYIYTCIYTYSYMYMYIGMDRIYQHETELGEYLYAQLALVGGLTLYGPPNDGPSGAKRTGLVAFNCKYYIILSLLISHWLVCIIRVENRLCNTSRCNLFS